MPRRPSADAALSPAESPSVRHLTLPKDGHDALHPPEGRDDVRAAIEVKVSRINGRWDEPTSQQFGGVRSRWIVMQDILIADHPHSTTSPFRTAATRDG